MEVSDRLKHFAAVQSAKAILKILPHLSEQRLLQFSLVQKGLDAVSYYPEGRDFLKSLLLHFRRSIPRYSRNCLHKFAENLLVNEFVTAAPEKGKVLSLVMGSTPLSFGDQPHHALQSELFWLLRRGLR